MQLTFLGATGTVTGSKYLITAGPKRILVDCGLFQGLKQLRLRNWEPLPIDPRKIDAVILTHAHIDHSGYLPLLSKNGFSGTVYCSRATGLSAAFELAKRALWIYRKAVLSPRHFASTIGPAIAGSARSHGISVNTGANPPPGVRKFVVCP